MTIQRKLSFHNTTVIFFQSSVFYDFRQILQTGKTFPAQNQSGRIAVQPVCCGGSEGGQHFFCQKLFGEQVTDEIFINGYITFFRPLGQYAGGLVKNQNMFILIDDIKIKRFQILFRIGVKAFCTAIICPPAELFKCFIGQKQPDFIALLKNFISACLFFI